MTALAYLLGYWLGDGSLDSDRRPGRRTFARLYGQEKDWPRVGKAVKKMGWRDNRRTCQPGLWELRMEYAFMASLAEAGLLTGDPFTTKVTDPIERRALLAGFFDADGNISVEKKARPGYNWKRVIHVRLTGIDEVQMNAARQALTELDIGTGFYTLPVKPPRRTTFQLKVRQASVERFLQLIPLQSYQMDRLRAS